MLVNSLTEFEQI